MSDRPPPADQRAVLACARRMLSGATPADHAAAGDAPQTVLALSFAYACCSEVTGIKMERLAPLLLACAEAAERELPSPN